MSEILYSDMLKVLNLKKRCPYESNRKNTIIFTNTSN
jgi:hypothetical protein